MRNEANPTAFAAGHHLLSIGDCRSSAHCRMHKPGSECQLFLLHRMRRQKHALRPFRICHGVWLPLLQRFWRTERRIHTTGKQIKKCYSLYMTAIYNATLLPGRFVSEQAKSRCTGSSLQLFIHSRSNGRLARRFWSRPSPSPRARWRLIGGVRYAVPVSARRLNRGPCLYVPIMDVDVMRVII